MKIDGASPYPYLPLPVDTPAVLQQGHLDVKQEVAEEHVEDKSRELVAQQAGAHAFSQTQQNSFVDATQQARNDLLLAKKPTESTKRGMKRSLATNQELRDPGQGPLTSGFQMDRNRQGSSLNPRATDALEGQAVPPHAQGQDGNGQEMPIRVSRRPVMRASVQAAQKLMRGEEKTPSEATNNLEPKFVVANHENPAVQKPSAFEIESRVHQLSDSLKASWDDKDIVAADWKQSHQLLSELNPGEAKEVLPKLDSMQMGLYLEGLEQVGAGVTTQDKSSAYEKVSRFATPGQLASSLEHIADRGSRESEQGVVGLGKAVGQHASTEAKMTFVEQAQRGLTDGDNRGIAMAYAMAGLKQEPQALQQLMDGLSSDQLQTLVNHASGKNVSVTMNPEAGATVTTSYNSEPLAELLDATRGLPSSRSKAELAQHSNRVLSEIANAVSTPENLVVKNNSLELLQQSLQGW